MKLVILVALVSICPIGVLKAQNSQTPLLIICKSDMLVSLDGEPKGVIRANNPVKFLVQAGEHYVYGRYFPDSLNGDVSETVTIENGKQKVLTLEIKPKSIEPTSAQIAADLQAELTKKVSDEAFAVDQLVDIISSKNVTSEQRIEAYKILAEKYPDIFEKYDKEYTPLTNMDAIQKEINKNIVDRAVEDVKAAAITQLKLNGAVANVVANLNFITESGLSSNYTSVNPGYKDDDTTLPVFYYAFEAGDIIELDVSMTNEKGTNVVAVSTYPENSLKYNNIGFKELKSIQILVEKRSIYRFVFGTNHIIPRRMNVIIRRIVADENKRNFKTDVHWKDTFIVRTIQSPQAFYVNSTTNLTAGKSRVSMQIRLPDNTVSWYYIFTASRDERAIESARSSMNLIGDLIGALGGFVGKVVKVGLDQFTVPPGSDYCNVYLLSYEDISNFNGYTSYNYFLQGSRENFKSSAVQITDFNSGVYYLGITNPDPKYGINIAIEVAAICKSGQYVFNPQ